jgi:hypothetical protein
VFILLILLLRHLLDDEAVDEVDEVDDEDLL